MAFHDVRKQQGDPILSGVGVEIGAGLSPVQHEGVDRLLFADKRTAAELTEWFGAKPSYDVLALDEVPADLDFVSSHHVLEHIDDPIGELVRWIGWLKVGGVLYFSIPSPNNSTERGRLATPLRHLLEDHFFRRDANSYESKQHIYSFIASISASGHDFWFGKSGVRSYAEHALKEVADRDDHDLHWHTLDLKTACEAVEIAFHLAGWSGAQLVAVETDDSLYVGYRKAAKATAPAALGTFHDSLSAAAAAVRLTL